MIAPVPGQSASIVGDESLVPQGAALASPGMIGPSVNDPLRILLTGTYNSCNKGDAAMQVTAIAELRRVNPDATITVSTPFPSLDRDLYSPVPVVKSGRRQGTAIARGLAWMVCRRLLGRGPVTEALASAEADATDSADVVVDLSGDMMTEDSGVLVGFSHMFPLLLAWACGTPYALLAQSIGPFRVLRPLARFLLKRAVLVTAREDLTSRNLQELAVRHDTTADLAFLLPPEVAEVDLPSGRLLAVVLSPLVANRYQRRTSRPLVADVAPAIDELAARLDATIVLLGHVTGPTVAKDDRITASELAGHLRHRHVVLDADLTPGQIKWVIGRAAAVVSARMHANIAALSQGVPALAISYSHKTSGIMAEFDQGDVVVDIDSIEDDLELAVVRFSSNLDARRATIEERLAEVRNRSKANVELLALRLVPE